MITMAGYQQVSRFFLNIDLYLFFKLPENNISVEIKT